MYLIEIWNLVHLNAYFVLHNSKEVQVEFVFYYLAIYYLHIYSVLGSKVSRWKKIACISEAFHSFADEKFEFSVPANKLKCGNNRFTVGILLKF